MLLTFDVLCSFLAESFSTVETVLEPAGDNFYLGSFTCGGNESSLLECDFSNGDSLREKRLNLCIEGTVVVCSSKYYIAFSKS